MAQFDVHENANPKTRKSTPYLLVVQADMLDDLATRVVAPLFAASTMSKPAQHLNPAFTINRTRVVMSTAELAGVPAQALGRKVASLKEQRNEIIAALDFLFTGY